MSGREAGKPIVALSQPKRFVSAEVLVERCRDLPPLDAAQFRRDIDSVVSTRLTD